MIRKPRGYDEARAYSNQELLPAGAYVAKIVTARMEGDCLLIAFDIEEGEYARYFRTQFDENTRDDRKWKGVFRLWLPRESDPEDRYDQANRRCKTEFGRIEESNEGYRWEWDETTLKGKLTGVVIRHKEYEFNGRRGFFADCFRLAAVDDVRAGKIKTPEPKLLGDDTRGSSGFTQAGDGDDQDLPF